MPLLKVMAYGFAAMFRPRELAGVFATPEVRLGKHVSSAWYAPDRAAFAYDFGAVVFVNVDDAERAAFLARLQALLGAEEPHPPLEEDFLVEVDPAAPSPGVVKFDRLVVPTLSPSVVELLALLLAQSVAIDYYEEDLREILAAVDRRTAPIARTGRITGSRREVIRFVGAALTTRNQVVNALSVLDKPVSTWESESSDRLYRDLREMLEIEERFRALDHKQKTVQDSLEVILDLQQTKRALLLETMIVGLIVFEVAFALAEKLWSR